MVTATGPVWWSQVDALTTRSYPARQGPDAFGEERARRRCTSVTAGELAFLAIGLILGIAAGAALVEIVRIRPSASREVRLTVAPDAVPRRRAATLANDAFTDSPVAMEPARGGPADRRQRAAEPVMANGRRTPVRTGEAPTVPAAARSGPAASANGTVSAPTVASPPRALAAAGTPGALAVAGGIDPMLTALRASVREENGATAAGSPIPAATAAARGGTNASATATATVVMEAQPIDDEGASPATIEPDPVESSGPCADARRLADERCEFATRARAKQAEAEDAHRAAQRAYDEHESAMAEAAAGADARAIRDAKDEAQARFRASRAMAADEDAVEAAARDWLQQINAINGRAREAAASLARARASAVEVAVRLERSSIEADGARIAAEAAESACVAARQALADCDERAAAGEVPSAGPGAEVDEDPAAPGAEVLVVAIRNGASPRILRLLRGDRSALQEMVAALGGDVVDERRQWQAALSDMVDAILSDSIAASALTFPTDHPFWGPFSQSQNREITSALASLGYRFDGLGGWVDGRVPSQRDLSLALGYAGLDPMRMRHWPTEREMESLFSDVQVAAVEHLAASAGDLSLGELVTMLGRRADGLADIWNAWGRIRPLLLEE
jgi:hypothetical protein